MTAAVGPFAVDEGLVAAVGDRVAVRIHNTNAGQLIISKFSLDEDQAAVDGEWLVPGVSGQGAPVRLEFQSPGGAATGRLLPTGDSVNVLDVVGVGPVEVSMVDAGNPCVFIAADALGLVGTEMPETLDSQLELLDQLEAIRCSASVAMGISDSMEAAAKISGIPKVGLVSPPQSAATLSGDPLDASQCDITLRMISVGQPHRAIPVTGSMCAAIAAQITGTVVNRFCRPATVPDDIRIAHPSGVARVGATVNQKKGKWIADDAVLYRTARRLMDGHVYVSAARTPGLSID